MEICKAKSNGHDEIIFKIRKLTRKSIMVPDEFPKVCVLIDWSSSRGYQLIRHTIDNTLMIFNKNFTIRDDKIL